MAVKFDQFEKLADIPAAQRLMKESIIKAAGKGEVKYVAVSNYKIGGKAVKLFMVVEKPDLFLAHIKKQGSTVAQSHGTAEVTLTPDKKNQVVVKKAAGSLTNTAISGFIKAAAGTDAFEGTTPERIKAQEEQDESDKAKRPKPSGADLARKSIAQAQAEGKLEADTPSSAPSKYKNKAGKDAPNLNVEITDDMVAKIQKLGVESAQYTKFASNFAKLADKYQFEEYKKIPVNIWAEMLRGLAKSKQYIKGTIPHTGQPEWFRLAWEGPAGEVIREDLLAEAMKNLGKYVAHAETYLDKVIEAVNQGGRGQTWAFWSGTGAQAAARKEAGGGVVLEGSIGSWFDDVYDFKPLTGVENLPLWAAMSELYAKKAAENYKAFKFMGFLGQGGTREQSVFNKIEQPTFVEVMGVRKNVPPPTIKWFVVDLQKDTKGAWVTTGNPSIPVASRSAAMDELKTRYGG